MAEYDTGDPGEAMDLHVHAFFDGHHVSVQRWPLGPVEERIPGFRVYEVGPGPRLKAWTFITSGCWRATSRHGHGLEFVLSAPDSDARHVEVLTMVGYYHAGPAAQYLDVGHTVPIGEPWMPGSACNHLLVSLPYAYGPDLETCAWIGGHARLLSVFPITTAERDYEAAHGVEALEQRMDDAATSFTDPRRASVV